LWFDATQFFLDAFSLNTPVARESPLYLLTENNLDQINPEDYGPDGIEDDVARVFHHWVSC